MKNYIMLGGEENFNGFKHVMARIVYDSLLFQLLLNLLHNQKLSLMCIVHYQQRLYILGINETLISNRTLNGV